MSRGEVIIKLDGTGDELRRGDCQASIKSVIDNLAKPIYIYVPLIPFY